MISRNDPRPGIGDLVQVDEEFGILVIDQVAIAILFDFEGADGFEIFTVESQTLGGIRQVAAAREDDFMREMPFTCEGPISVNRLRTCEMLPSGSTK